MAVTTISPKFQIVIPKEVREKLRRSPRQHLQIMEKDGIITPVPEVPIKLLKAHSKACPRRTCGRRRTHHKGSVEVPFSWKRTLL